MSITIFYFLLLIVQIIMLVKTIKKTNKRNWSLLLSTIMTSIALVVVFFIYSWVNMNYIGWNFIAYLIINIIAGDVYVLMLIISIIMKVIKNKKYKTQKLEENELEKKSIKKSLIITTLTIVIVFLIALFIEDLPYKIEQKNDKIAENKAKEQIIILLNQQYGDGNFEIVEMVEKDICYSCSWMGPGVDGYEFTMSTDYLNKNFIVSLTKENFEIYENDFLSEYYKENLGITDLENYLKDYKIKKLNEIISQNFNAEIDFNNIFMNDYSDINYGQIPTIEELSNYVELHDPKIEIKEDLKTKDDLLNYLVKFSKFFIKDFDTSNITYSQTSKYFRYKYDYTKLGVNNYTDQYNGYGGYVLAGNYKYSEEQGRYVIEDEDTIVRINIMGNVTTFNIEDILKD
ncbi:MAG: hypothetical protein MR598_07875 [Erysipelotrichaceae bacterium]|nr:hypothetical protein [Erysipelotrichaceae bacterium]